MVMPQNSTPPEHLKINLSHQKEVHFLNMRHFNKQVNAQQGSYFELLKRARIFTLGFN